MAERPSILVSEEELALQKQYMAQVRSETCGGKYKIVTSAVR